MAIQFVPISATLLQKYLRNARYGAIAKSTGRAFVSKVFPPESVDAVQEPGGHGIVLLPSFDPSRVPSLIGWLREQRMRHKLYGMFQVERRRWESEGTFEGALFVFDSMSHQVHFRLMVDETRPYTAG